MKKILYTLLGIGITLATSVYAINVTIPQSTAYGQIPVGNAVGGGYTPMATSTLGISGGSGTPGGATTQVQYNNGGAFGGSSTFLWDKAFNTLTLGDGSFSGYILAPNTLSLFVVSTSTTQNRIQMNPTEIGFHPASGVNGITIFGNGASGQTGSSQIKSVAQNGDQDTFSLPYENGITDTLVAQQTLLATAPITYNGAGRYGCATCSTITSTGVSGNVARWTSSTNLGTGVLLDTGTVAGVNGTVSTAAFNALGTSVLDPFQAGTSTRPAMIVVRGNTGYVGVATSTPISQLDVNVISGINGGTFKADATTPTFAGNADNLLTVRGTGSSASTWRGRITSGGDNIETLFGEYNSQAWIGAHDSTLSGWRSLYINPETGVTTKVFIGAFNGRTNSILTVDSATGSVGVNTPSPTATLMVTGQTGATNPFVVASSTGTNIITVTPSGNTGFSTSTPTATVDIYTSVASTTPLLLETVSGGGCILVKDVAGTGYTQLYTQAGVLSARVHTGSLTLCN